VKFIQKVGSFLLAGIKLQIYFFLTSLKGGIVLGVFPALLGVFKILQRCLVERDFDHIFLGVELKKWDKSEFWHINALGWLFLALLFVLSFNLRFAEEIIHNGLFHVFTLVVLIIHLIISFNVFALFAKYRLPFKQYLLQGFLCALFGLPETIAFVFGMSLAFGLSLTIPPLGFFLGIPFMMLPYAWFTLTSVKRFELKFYQKDRQE